MPGEIGMELWVSTEGGDVIASVVRTITTLNISADARRYFFTASIALPLRVSSSSIPAIAHYAQPAEDGWNQPDSGYLRSLHALLRS